MITSPIWHAGMAERANRSIKERLYRYFTENKTLKWVDVIQDIVNSINNSFNSSIGMRPIDVNYENAESLRRSLKEKALEQHGPTRWKENSFNVGDPVRVEKNKQVFKKGYLQTLQMKYLLLLKSDWFHISPPHIEFVIGEEL